MNKKSKNKNTSDKGASNSSKPSKKDKTNNKIDRPRTFDNFLNRDLMWLSFNERVLYQVLNSDNPLLERLRFCDIYRSNLDEFYMKRVGNLKSYVDSRNEQLSIDGQTPIELLRKIRGILISQQQILQNSFDGKIIAALKKENIELLKWYELNDEKKEYLRNYFLKNIFPLLTPLAVDFAHPFPFISNLSKSIGVRLQKPGNEDNLFARVKIPFDIAQWVSLPTDEVKHYEYINIEEVILNNLDILYPGMSVISTMVFRVTRHAVMDIYESNADDLVENIEEGLRETKFSKVIRLEYESKSDPWLINFLREELNLLPGDLYEMTCLPNYSLLEEIYKHTDRTKLKFKFWKPKLIPTFLDEPANIFATLRRKDILVHHPYESFSGSVEKFIQAAAVDPKVKAIKLTLYRTDHNSQIIANLIRAIENGKQVACVVELKARFDEEKNLHWAEKLENSGVHVVYGMAGLKTHSKMCLVVRLENRALKTYAHLGTGNYNSQTSKIYTDISYFTSKDEICSEVMEVFNFLTGYSLRSDYQRLLVAPVCMKKRFLQLIGDEIKAVKKHGHGRIIAKMNSLEDIEIINALYGASCAGVKITLIVRGFCCLRPGVKDLSENIEVRSIIGRFLEHSRIFYFSNGEKQLELGKFFIGSADWMYRNLNNRVEVITPIVDHENVTKLSYILKTFCQDNKLSWLLDSQGRYKLEFSDKGEDINAHNVFMESSEKKDPLKITT